MTHAIETHALAKRFGDTRALDGVDLHIRQGSVFGLLGPNGAGKTTTIRILATLIQPDGGGATVLGHDLVRDARRVREKVSLTGQIKDVTEVLSAIPLAEVDSVEVKRFGFTGVTEITAAGASFKLEGKVDDMREVAAAFERAKATA